MEGEHTAEITADAARQATGPRGMSGVLAILLLLVAAAGTALLAYFYS